MKRLMILVSIVALAVLLAVPAEGGQASCSVSPNPVPVGSQYTVSVQNGPANTLVSAWVNYSGPYGDEHNILLDGSGSGSTNFTAYDPSMVGQGSVAITFDNTAGKGSRITSCKFTVV